MCCCLGCGVGTGAGNWEKELLIWAIVGAGGDRLKTKGAAALRLDESTVSLLVFLITTAELSVLGGLD